MPHTTIEQHTNKMMRVSNSLIACTPDALDSIDVGKPVNVWFSLRNLLESPFYILKCNTFNLIITRVDD